MDYRNGREHIDEVRVVKASPKQVTLAAGVDASGYRPRLAPYEVHHREQDALDALYKQIERAVEHAEAELQRHRDAMRRVHDRRAALRKES